MNLAQQFPDATVKMRDKLKLRKKTFPWKNMNSQKDRDEDKSMTKFYDNEFMKWHLKLILIIALAIASLSFVILNVSRFFLVDH